MRAIASFFLMTIVGQNAFAGSYSVTLREFGFNRPNCSEDIAVVAQAFAVDAHAVILSSGCLPPTIGHTFPTGKFTYLSANWVDTTTSDYRETWNLDGHYKSIAACESALHFERGVFNRLTGLQPYVGYCYQANSIGAPRYRVRLDAVGVSPIKKRSLSTSWMQRPAKERELVSDVESLVTSLGGEVIAATVDRGITGYLAAVDYYHEKAFYLHSQELLYWRSAELCQLSADSLNEQWGSSVIKSIFHCTTMQGGTSRLLQIYVSDLMVGGIFFDTEIHASVYDSQSACLLDASRIQDIFEQSGMTVLGMACGQDVKLQSWHLTVFSLTK